ncbi:MAG: reverse transcriptase domain-containing protein [Candidatus Roizmanbacteria bacterium]
MVTKNFYEDSITVEQLFLAWDTFKLGKKSREDVRLFERYLENNIFNLHYSLKSQSYTHDRYEDFFINDPKRRHIHKATVTDRLVHQVLYSALYPIFDPSFIFDSYSCRNDKGTHRAVKRAERYLRKSSQNYTHETYILKCDIKKYFASVDKNILYALISRKIHDPKLLWLIYEVIHSFASGLPLGNLTSQLFANVYLHELDLYIKHALGVKDYIRYCDDFIIIHPDKKYLQSLVKKIDSFLTDKLKLHLHPQKVFIRKFSWGIDFLGYILFPHYILPRTKTKKRMIERLEKYAGWVIKRRCDFKSFNNSFQSYLGYLKHAHSYMLQQDLKSKYCLLGENLI